MNNQTELFEREKDGEGCLSSWQVSRLALSLTPVAEEERLLAHVRDCPHCAAKLREEREGVEAAKFERVPERLLSHAANVRRRREWFSPRMFAGLAMAGAVAAMLIVVPKLGLRKPRIDVSDGIRVKGGLHIEATILRDGQPVASRVPLGSVRDLRPGDRIRVWVPVGEKPRWVMYQGWDDDRWDTYFEGTPHESGFLPPVVEITGEGATRLRVVSCDRKQPSSLLEERLREGDCRLEAAFH